MPVVSLSHLSDKGMSVISYGILRLYANVEVMWSLHLASLSDFDECKENGVVFIRLDCQYDNSKWRKSKTKLTFIILFSYQAYSSFNLQHDWIISVYLKKGTIQSLVINECAKWPP